MLIHKEVYPENSEAQYFADQTGVFEIVQAKDITHGKVMKQVSQSTGVLCI